MQASAIRQLAISDHKGLVAAAFIERTIQIWSWETGQQLGEFQSMFDFGGRRLAILSDASACIVGAWGQRGRGPRGLGAYSLPDGKLMWNRSELKHIQYVTISGSGKEIYCGVDDGPAYLVNATDGEIVGRARTVERIFDSSYGSHQLLVRRKRPYLLRGVREIEIRPDSFALLGAAFSSTEVCLSEPQNFLHPHEQRGGTRVIDLSTGETRWHLNLMAGPLTFNVVDENFYGVSGVDGSPRKSSLIRLKGKLDECESLTVMDNCWDSAFSPSGKALVSAQGEVYETATGALLRRLEFPQREYASL